MFVFAVAVAAVVVVVAVVVADCYCCCCFVPTDLTRTNLPGLSLVKWSNLLVE